MMTRVFRSAPLPPLPGLDPDAARPVVMGIVNVTADSFSGDGLLKNGEPGDATRAIAQARAQVARSEERREGKSVSVRVDLGGRRIIKKQNTTSTQYREHESTLKKTTRTT